MSDNFVLGLECKLYFSATLVDDGSNTPDQISWTEIGNAKDVTLNLEAGEADITTRGNSGWRATAPTLRECTVEFQMVWKPGDAVFEAIQTAWSSSSEIAIAAMDGAIATVGKQGLAGNFTVTNFSRSEPLEEAATVSVTLKPSSYTTWYEVAA